jgi:cytochrome c-type biogenesis protein CcmF
MLIARRQNYALLAAYVMITLSFVLILYASFLTRSGVLADSSVHSFGENGMSAQLLVYLLVFFLMMVMMIGLNIRKLQSIREDNLLSREFWMFIGSIIMVLAAFQVIFTTSIPVFNTLFNTSIAPPVDPIGFYNRWQMPFALLISGFIAFTQLLNYRENDPGQFLKKMFIPLGAAIIFCIPMIVTGVVTQLNFILLVFFTFFALFSALYNMFFLPIRPKNTAAIITHIGFVIFILGTVITFSNSKVISSNTSQYDLGNQRDNAENLVLMRSDTLFMNGFYVCYVKNSSQVNTTVYQVDFMKKVNGKYVLDFSLHPSVNVHPKMGAVYNPDTKHFPGSDFYTYIAIVSKEPDYIVIKAIMNPYINVLWLGSVIMLAGLGMAFVRRARNRWLGNS